MRTTATSKPPATPSPAAHGASHPLGQKGLVQLPVALMMAWGRGPAARAVLQAAGLTAHDTVVDVGCGPGTAVRLAVRTGAQGIGVDPSWAMVKVARGIGALRPPGGRFVLGRAEELGLPDGTASVVWAISAAHHFSDLRAAAGEAHRVLTPGGRLVLAERLVPEAARGHPAHGFTDQAAQEALEILGAAGFTALARRSCRAGRRTVVLLTGAR